MPEQHGSHADLGGRSRGDLIKDMSSQVSTLMHREIDPAKAEMTPKAKAAAERESPAWPGS